ncbi:MAG: hypothetical protein H6807_13845 [Planctomycetes bacterium]|nr:hypothetical protein [Planctomycetota bacterium]
MKTRSRRLSSLGLESLDVTGHGPVALAQRAALGLILILLVLVATLFLDLGG